ncbi:MAG: dihydrodipicolinate synthase family protein [Saprospiraceae bacterium]|nr:dihydrodipicolinate synthase family protein [Saprospiraceae bacterium]
MSNSFQSILQHLHAGTVIPAHPLALDENLNLDEQRQRLLTRYYLAAGAGGVAVGVHTTQFEIRDPSINLLEPVLKLAAEEINKAGSTKPIIKIAGICGPTDQALKEATLAVEYGYHFGLLSPGGLAQVSETELLDRARAVSEIIPVIGFYLQEAVGGRVLSYDFWRLFVEIPNVHAIKVAAFNRYQTLDVVRAVCDSPRKDEIALYTGNDDNIVSDLLTPYRFVVNGKTVEKRFVGGLLGHWAVWTQNAVDQLIAIKQCLLNNYQGIETLLSMGMTITDCNAAFFDTAHQFKGCIAGIHEVLRRQGLLKGIWCLNPREQLSNGQSDEIDRVFNAYPHLNDDEFVNEFLLNEKIIGSY